MEHYQFTEDIDVVYLTARLFPNDVAATYKKLQALISDNPNRRYFGISHPDKTGSIQYKACAETFPSDNFSHMGLQKFTIAKGNFAAIYIVNHINHSNCIGIAFRELLNHAKLDPNGYCLEVYKNSTDLDVHCMVRLIEQVN